MFQQIQRLVDSGPTRHLGSCYALDARSLAVFRIAVGLVVLVDFVRRLQHSTALYSDSGVLTRRDAIAWVSPSRWSVLFSNGSPEFVKVFIFFGVIAVISMIAGWRTRIATVIVWIVVVSLQVRNVGVNDGADNLIRLSLFWAMFLPLGRVWSVDEMRASEAEESRPARWQPVVSLAGFGLILQQASMYWFTAMLKEGPRWTEDGTALYYALGMGHVTRASGGWLFQHAPLALLVGISFATLVLEFAVPILLVLPLKSGFLRMSAIALIWSLHLGIAATMEVELFPYISTASAIALLPAQFWTALTPRLSMLMAKVRSRWMPDWQPSERPAYREANGYSAQRNSAGAANIHFLPQFDRATLSSQGLITLICAFAIVLSAMSNVDNVSSYTVPSTLRAVTNAAGLQQSWRMFAPQPGGSTIWYVIEGELESGEVVDLLIPLAQGDMSIKQPIVWNQSESVLHPDKFWRKYFTSIRNSDNFKFRFANYACRTWNHDNSGGDRLVSLSLFRGTSRVLPNSEHAEPNFVDLGSWDCT